MNRVSPSPTWNINDPSKIQCAMDCERMFMYEHIFGWRTSAPNNHLHFGTSWHKAMEHLLLNGYEDMSIVEAYDKFLTHYRTEFTSDTDTLYAPKDPANALSAMKTYAREYKDDLNKFEVLYTEISGTVPITREDILYFRMDSIVKDKSDGSYYSIEHKTGSTLSRQWQDQWSLKTQIGTYTHVMKCLFPPDEVKGVKVRGTFFQKKENKFTQIPVWKTKDAMQVWLWNVVNWMHRIKQNIQILMEDCHEEDEVLMAFPMNTESCTKYFGCPYHDFCTAWSNPLRQYGEPPLGFKSEFWNPMDEETTTKMDLV